MRLPDDLLIRGRTRGTGTIRERRVLGRTYRAVSIWDSGTEAQAAAEAIRVEGGLARVSREPVAGRLVWIVWTSPSLRSSPSPAPDPRRQLPDALLIRDYFGQGVRTRIYDGIMFSAVSIWEAPDAARVAAEALRAGGALARVTREKRPLRAYDGKSTEQILRLRRGPGRYMWVVWVDEKPACAGHMEGLTE